jgi:hypothetical protein
VVIGAGPRDTPAVGDRVGGIYGHLGVDRAYDGRGIVRSSTTTESTRTRSGDIRAAISPCSVNPRYPSRAMWRLPGAYAERTRPRRVRCRMRPVRAFRNPPTGALREIARAAPRVATAIRARQ